MPIDRTAPRNKWRLAGVLLFTIAGLLLLSMGGAVLAAPVTVPLMLVVCQRHRTTTFRVAGVVLVGLTVAEVVWALTYLQLQEAQPWIWLVPLLGGVIAAASFMAATKAAAATMSPRELYGTCEQIVCGKEPS
ncbi:MAG TPA: hypothetical protein VGV93_10235 [Acidimicrobiales bacterium]|nr:hypothetical protein [Acidimicrobiales bacterium]